MKKKVRVIGADAPTRYIRHFYIRKGRRGEAPTVRYWKVCKCLTSEQVGEIVEYIDENPDLCQAEVDRLYKSIEFRKFF